MQFWIEQDGEIVEDFEAKGHRNTKKSDMLDALKVAAAWGYHNHEGYVLVAETGETVELCDPYKTPRWQREMAKDFEHIVREKA